MYDSDDIYKQLSAMICTIWDMYKFELEKIVK